MVEYFTLKYHNVEMVARAHADIFISGTDEQMLQITSFPTNNGMSDRVNAFSMSDEGEYIALTSTKKVNLPKGYSSGIRDFIDLSQIQKYCTTNYSTLVDYDDRTWACLLLMRKPQLLISFDILHHYRANPQPSDMINLDEKQKNKTSEAINEILRWILDWAIDIAGRNPLELVDSKSYLALHDFKMNQYAETYIKQKNKKLSKRYDDIMKLKEKELERGYIHKQKLLAENFKIKESELENAYKGALLLPKNMGDITTVGIISLIKTNDVGHLKVYFLTKFEYKPIYVSFRQRDKSLHELSEFGLSLPKRDYYVGLEYNPNLTFCRFVVFKRDDINDTYMKHPHISNGNICMGDVVDKATKITQSIFKDRKMNIDKFYEVIAMINQILKEINLGGEYGHDFTYEDERNVITKLDELDVKQKENKKESVFIDNIDKDSDSEEDNEDEEEPEANPDETEIDDEPELEPEH